MTTSSQEPLLPWMRVLLWFAGGFNLLAGASMIVFYHEGYKLLGIAKPALPLPVQAVGILVGLFGVGYLMVAVRPIENRGILVLGWWSKALGAVAALWYVGLQRLPWWFAIVVVITDVIWLPPFYLILRRLYGASR